MQIGVSVRIDKCGGPEDQVRHDLSHNNQIV